MAQESQITTRRNGGFVELAGTVDELEKRFKLYQEVKQKVLNADDKVQIGDTEYIKKSGRTKYEVAFNISTKILEERKEVNPADPTKYAYHFTVKALADNGRFTEEVGTCDNTEKSNVAEHIVRSMAKTRATSRAVFELIGAGDVSAEEGELIHKKNGSSEALCTCPSGKRNWSQGRCQTCGLMVPK